MFEIESCFTFVELDLRYFYHILLILLCSCLESLRHYSYYELMGSSLMFLNSLMFYAMNVESYAFVDSWMIKWGFSKVVLKNGV